MNDPITARIALLDHLKAQGDRVGVRLAYAALDAADYELGTVQERERNWRRAATDAFRPRGIAGEAFSVKWANGELTHSIRGQGNGRA